MSRKIIFILIVFVATVIFTVSLTKFFTFKSDHKWVSISEYQVPAVVRDTLDKQRSNKLFELVTILDSSFLGKVSFNIVNNHFVVGGYDYYEIGYKEN